MLVEGQQPPAGRADEHPRHPGVDLHGVEVPPQRRRDAPRGPVRRTVGSTRAAHAAAIGPPELTTTTGPSRPQRAGQGVGGAGHEVAVRLGVVGVVLARRSSGRWPARRAAGSPRRSCGSARPRAGRGSAATTPRWSNSSHPGSTSDGTAAQPAPSASAVGGLAVPAHPAGAPGRWARGPRRRARRRAPGSGSSPGPRARRSRRRRRTPGRAAPAGPGPLSPPGSGGSAARGTPTAGPNTA